MTEAGWQELRFDTQQAAVEALEDWLFAEGALAVTLEDNADEPLLEPGPGETPLWQQVKVVALFEAGRDLAPLLAAVPQELIVACDDAARHVPDQDWVRAWEDQFHPMAMGDRLWVCPSWCEPPDPTAVNLRLDPGLAFGSGTHPTTAMCLKALDRLSQAGQTVIDYGCGTGILAIAALLLGAERALGVDNDPQAITASGNNAEANGIDPARFVLSLPGTPEVTAWQSSADVLVANILAGPLASLAPDIKALLKPGGTLLMAGLLEPQAEALIEVYAPECQLRVADQIEEWVLLEGQLSPA